MKINITTPNAQMSGWRTISDAEIAEIEARVRSGCADIYDQTYLANLHTVSVTTARRKFHATTPDGESI